MYSTHLHTQNIFGQFDCIFMCTIPNTCDALIARYIHANDEKVNAANPTSDAVPLVREDRQLDDWLPLTSEDWTRSLHDVLCRHESCCASLLGPLLRQLSGSPSACVELFWLANFCLSCLQLHNKYMYCSFKQYSNLKYIFCQSIHIARTTTKTKLNHRRN